MMYYQFVIFNSWKLPWNWIAFYQNPFIISPGCYITWLNAIMDDLQTRPLRQILLFLWNNSLTFWKLQTVMLVFSLTKHLLKLRQIFSVHALPSHDFADISFRNMYHFMFNKKSVMTSFTSWTSFTSEHLVKFTGHKSFDNENINYTNYTNSHVTLRVPRDERSYGFKEGASHCKSVDCLDLFP